jgi:hypothetical protein
LNAGGPTEANGGTWWSFVTLPMGVPAGRLRRRGR